MTGQRDSDDPKPPAAVAKLATAARSQAPRPLSPDELAAAVCDLAQFAKTTAGPSDSSPPRPPRPSSLESLKATASPSGTIRSALSIRREVDDSTAISEAASDATIVRLSTSSPQPDPKKRS